MSLAHRLRRSAERPPEAAALPGVLPAPDELRQPIDDASRKIRVALASAAAAVCMTLLKLAAGLFTGSLGMLAEAAHSGLDLAGSLLTYFSVRVSDKPADEEHTYGHAKVENLAAFVESFLMLVSCIWISFEAIERIFVHNVQVRHSFWAPAVLAASMAVDLWRSRRLKVEAVRTHSDALEADALHFAADMWTSAAVLVGLTLSWLGTLWSIPWLRYADSITALLVSALILNFSWRLGVRTVGALVDSVPAQTHRDVLAELQRVQDVLSIDRARMRRAGKEYFADLTISLSRGLTFQRTEQLVDDATAAVRRVLPGADVVIRTVARQSEAESIFDRIRAVASRNNVVLHDVSVQTFGDALHIEQHIEVDEKLALQDAHRFVRRIEDEIREQLPQVQSVLTHIESEPATIEQTVAVAQDRALEEQLRRAAATLEEVVDVHDVVIGRVSERLMLSCHCTLPDDLPMQRVHEVITALEARFKATSPEVSRVLIHPEPATDNHHR